MEQTNVDVLIIGAGLSGIGAGYHLQTLCPQKTYAIVEGRASIGGTWDLFRYPGIRSDSDMYTLGYSFRPWTNPKSIADGPSILEYVKDTARTFGIDQHIRFNQKAVKASWSSQDSKWTVEVTHSETGVPCVYRCSFLFACAGYYNYEGGYTPEFQGMESFKGRIVHPQKWTEDIDYAGKKVVVIGSGATAVTLVPAMTDKAEHVTMLQRSPSYVLSVPDKDPIAGFLRKHLPEKSAYSVTRWKNVAMSMAIYNYCRKRPESAKKFLVNFVKKRVGEHVDVGTHFTPSYKPWDQRMCLVPNGDLFKVIRKGKASVVTDHIDRFTEKGILLKSGKELEADIIVTATGLRLQFLGGMKLVVDGKAIEPSQTMAYKGMMCSDVPNMALAIGYTNASWTLKCDLTCEYVCRLINHMDQHGYTQCCPRRNDPKLKEEPLLDFSSGYVQRAINDFPRQGSFTPWKLHQNYALDTMMLRHAKITDKAMTFV